MEMISQDELLHDLVEGGYGNDFYIDAIEGARICTLNNFDPSRKYNVALGYPHGYFVPNAMQYVYYNETGNGVSGVSGDYYGDNPAGDYEFFNRQNRFGVRFTTTFDDGTSTAQYEFTWNWVQASHNVIQATNRTFSFFLGAIGMPVFNDQTKALAYCDAVAAYLVNHTLENLEACKKALRKSMNPIYKDEDKYGPPSKPGGYGEDDDGGDTGKKGSWDNSSDKIGLPNKPSIGVSNMGFVNVYRVSAGALTALGNDIFPHIAAGADILQCLTAISDSLFNARLIDYVIDCHIMPCDVPASGGGFIQVGGRTCSATGALVTSDYVDVNCGTLNIEEYFANYLDYIGTKTKLFLPFVGFIDLKPEFWQAGLINVFYRFDVIDGSFMCFIRSSSSKSKLSESVIAQYGGSCAVHVPITGANYASLYSTLIGNGATAAIAAAGGQIGSAASAAGGLMSSMFNLANQSAPVQQSNSYNATSSFLSIRKPFLLIERPTTQFSWGYPKEHGFPLNEYVVLGSVSGFTVVDNVKLNFVCSDEEMEEIKRLLREGVYF